MTPSRPIGLGRIQSGVLLGGAVLTLVLQTIALTGVVWKGAAWAQHVDDEQRHQLEATGRIVQQLDAIEHRVHDLEVRRP